MRILVNQKEQILLTHPCFKEVFSLLTNFYVQLCLATFYLACRKQHLLFKINKCVTCFFKRFVHTEKSKKEEVKIAKREEVFCNSRRK